MDLFSFLLRNSPARPQAASFLRYLGHKFRHTQKHIRSRNPVNAWSIHRRSRYLHNEYGTQHTNIHNLRWIRTCDPSNQATADLRFRPRGPAINFMEWYRQGRKKFSKIFLCDFAQNKFLMDESGIETGTPPRQDGEGPRYTIMLRKYNWELLRFSTVTGRDTWGSESTKYRHLSAETGRKKNRLTLHWRGLKRYDASSVCYTLN